jgi:hypothetical protein
MLHKTATVLHTNTLTKELTQATQTSATASQIAVASGSGITNGLFSKIWRFITGLFGTK